MKKFLSILVCGVLILGISGCGSENKKESNVVGDLNKVMTDCLKENDSTEKKGNCTMNWLLQDRLKTYSSYELLNTSQTEFTTKPQEPNSLFTYGTSRDGLCAYKYALMYNKDSKNYYSVELDCADKEKPAFKTAKKLG